LSSQIIKTRFKPLGKFLIYRELLRIQEMSDKKFKTNIRQSKMKRQNDTSKS